MAHNRLVTLCLVPAAAGAILWSMYWYKKTKREHAKSGPDQSQDETETNVLGRTFILRPLEQSGNNSSSLDIHRCNSLEISSQLDLNVEELSGHENENTPYQTCYSFTLENWSLSCVAETAQSTGTSSFMAAPLENWSIKNLVESNEALRVPQFLGWSLSSFAETTQSTGTSSFMAAPLENWSIKKLVESHEALRVPQFLEIFSVAWKKIFKNFILQVVKSGIFDCMQHLDFQRAQKSVQSVKVISDANQYLLIAGKFTKIPPQPSIPCLAVLQRRMNAIYSSEDVPALPHSADVDSICVARLDSMWHRAKIVALNQEFDSAIIMLVDYYFMFYTVDTDQLKQIRIDLLALPFQAYEKILSCNGF